MRDPTPQLSTLLRETGLCSRRDLGRTRRLVAGLARDLPAFDTVWIDALLQLRLITHYQAEILQSKTPKEIRMGPCVVVDRLGSGAFGETFLARRIGTRQTCVLKRLRHDLFPDADVAESLQDVVGASRRRADTHSPVVMPVRCLSIDGQAVLISEYVNGPNLRQVLIRRGRLPADLVSEIAGQVLEGMQQLEQSGFVHGDLRLSNVRLRPDGRLVLVDAVIQTLLAPTFSVHHCRRPVDCDGIAPERHRNGHRADARSELFALGCLLWELLTGRPPFPTTDLHRRLAGYATQSIADPREWAPECPARLADWILRCVALEPEVRPASIQEAMGQLSDRRTLTPRLTKSFAASLKTPTPPASSRRGSLRRALPMATAAVLLAGAAAAFLSSNGNTKRTLLEIRKQPRPSADETAIDSGATPVRPDSRAASPLAEFELQPLPEPDRRGIIRLNSAAPYQARDIAVAGPVSVVGPLAGQATIVSPDGPWILTAETVSLRNVDVIARPPAQSIITATCQNLRFEHCSLLASESDSGKVVASGLKWTADDVHDRAGRRLSVHDSIVFGTHAGVTTQSPAEAIGISNTLLVTRECAVDCRRLPRAGQPCRIVLTDTTLRSARSVLNIGSDASVPGPTSQWFHVDMDNSVFELRLDSGTLVRTTSRPAEDSAEPAVVFAAKANGELSLVSERSAIAQFVDPDSGAVTRGDEICRVEGIIESPLDFKQPAAATAEAARLVNFVAPRRSARAPGCIPDRLPSANQLYRRHTAQGSSLHHSRDVSKLVGLLVREVPAVDSVSHGRHP